MDGTRVGSLRHFSVAAFILTLSILQGCGGGGGGGNAGNGGNDGGGSSAPQVVPSQASLQVTVAVNSEQPNPTPITLTVTNASSQYPYIGGRYSTEGVSTMEFQTTASGQLEIVVVFKPPASLEVGTYSDSIELFLCGDTDCNDILQSSVITIPVTYQVNMYAAGSAPTLTLATTQLNLQDLVTDQFALDSLNVTITLSNFGAAPYISISPGSADTPNGNIALQIIAYAQGTTQGTLQVSPLAGYLLGAGSYSFNFQITACLDLNCVYPVPGSPFAFTVNYQVGSSITQSGANGYTLTAMNYQVTAMDWDAVHGSLVLAGNGTGSPAVVTLNPVTQSVLASASLAANPDGAVAVSDDGAYAYVSLANGTIQRFTLPMLTPDITISLGSNYPIDIKVQPGHAHTIAVSEASSSSAYDYGGDDELGVAIFDNGVQRPLQVQATLNPAAGAAVDYLSWSGDGTTLYGTSRQLPGLFTLPVNAQGIPSFTASGTFANSNALNFGYTPHWSGGLVYLDGGQVIDPASGNSTIVIPAQSGPIAMAPDVSGGLLFATSMQGGPQTTLSVLSLPGYTPVTSFLLTGQIEAQASGPEPTMLLLRGGSLAAPILVIKADNSLAFISGPVMGQ
jgi:hypothetical protein